MFTGRLRTLGIEPHFPHFRYPSVEGLPSTLTWDFEVELDTADRWLGNRIINLRDKGVNATKSPFLNIPSTATETTDKAKCNKGTLLKVSILFNLFSWAYQTSSSDYLISLAVPTVAVPLWPLKKTTKIWFIQQVPGRVCGKSTNTYIIGTTTHRLSSLAFTGGVEKGMLGQYSITLMLDVLNKPIACTSMLV